jgi:hypothetical protein
MAALRRRWLELKGEGSPMGFSMHDGADECAALLLALAQVQHSDAPPAPLRLLLHPSVPSPENYSGRFESRNLGEGLDLLGKLLRFDYESVGEEQADWLVCFGRQPQDDVFEIGSQKAFAYSAYLPEEMPRGRNLFVSDLCACNGANPLLAERLTALGREPHLLCGWNTNFNTLGYSAAAISLALRGRAVRVTMADFLDVPADVLEQRSAALARLKLLHQLDDLFYQSCAREGVVKYCKDNGINHFDFSSESEEVKSGLLTQLRLAWNRWHMVECMMGKKYKLGLDDPGDVQFSLPWDRAFECEVALY